MRMPDRTVRDFPMFPLGLVALPHELVPLHIFEARYRDMFAECSSSEGEFGIVWLTEVGREAIGCACEIDAGPRAHGGRAPERPHARHAAVSDRRASRTTCPIRPRRRVPPRQGRGARRARRARRAQAYAALVVEATDHEPDADELADKSAYEMAATVDFGLDAKQGLLDLRSENARLRLVTRLFRAAIKRLDFVERAQARARSNGKVRFG